MIQSASIDIQSEANDQPADGTVSLGQLAHELNSLLDGSIRCLALAQRALVGQSRSGNAGSAIAAGAIDSGVQIAIDDALARLQTAQTGLRQMASLLDRAMEKPLPRLGIFEQRQPLEAQIQQILDALEPVITEHHIDVVIDLTPKAASLPTCTLGPVILNGLRNAIDACTGSDQPQRRVELAVAVKSTDQLMIVISDNGSGMAVEDDLEPGVSTKPGGHGLGLDLCRQIVTELGGELRLTNVPFGVGAVLQVMIPVRRLLEHV